MLPVELVHVPGSAETVPPTFASPAIVGKEVFTGPSVERASAPGAHAASSATTPYDNLLVMRILERLDRIYAIGDRSGYSAQEDEAHALAADWMREAGLDVEVDGASNLIGRRGAAHVWTGSHLDSVPNGGKYDGALGVLAGIEAAERLPDAELGIVAFRAEETGPMGSKKLTQFPEAFVELHIEQGPVLERAGQPLGVVTAIAGQARGAVIFEGRADHAGTTPMDGREDALVQAARFVLHVNECARDGAVATVGAVTVEPNAVNVVPARVTVSVDARAPRADQLDELVAAIGFEPASRLEPVEMSGPPFETLSALLPDAPRLASGAGHDAMVLAAAGVPTGMLFVRSLNGGASHSPDEFTSNDDIALAVDVLTRALERLSAR
jgi:acetylornithine deacetylase/succinyl-diaminopimelate desuccinylase-like protein